MQDQKYSVHKIQLGFFLNNPFLSKKIEKIFIWESFLVKKNIEKLTNFSVDKIKISFQKNSTAN